MSETLDPVTLNHVRLTADRLADEFAGIFSFETIERYLSESLDLLGGPASMYSCPCSPIGSRASG